MDKNMTLEKRIAAELYSYQGKMSVFVDDLHGHTVEIGACGDADEVVALRIIGLDGDAEIHGFGLGEHKHECRCGFRFLGFGLFRALLFGTPPLVGIDLFGRIAATYACEEHDCGKDCHPCLFFNHEREF